MAGVLALVSQLVRCMRKSEVTLALLSAVHTPIAVSVKS